MSDTKGSIFLMYRDDSILNTVWEISGISGIHSSLKDGKYSYGFCRYTGECVDEESMLANTKRYIQLKQNSKEFTKSLATEIEELIDQEYNLDKIEHVTIMAALKKTKGNRTKAAKLLGRSVRTLRNKMSEYRKEGTLECSEETGRIQPWLRKRKHAKG